MPTSDNSENFDNSINTARTCCCGRRRWRASAAAGAAAAPPFSGPRVVVAVLGGATYSELRAAYEVSRDTHREVIMGGSALLAPGGFLASLAD